MENFILVSKGINNWKRYLLSFFLLFAIVIISEVFTIFIMKWYVENDGNPVTFYDPVYMESYTGDRLINYAFSILPCGLSLLGMAGVMQLIHKRSLLTLITQKKKVDWKKFLWGFSFFLSLLILTTVCDFLLFPNDYKVNPIQVSRFIMLFLLVIVIVPFQSIMEELFYRGFFLQWIGLKIHNIVILSFIVGAINGLIYIANDSLFINPLFTGLQYILTGIVLSFIAAKTNSLELSFGARTANNLFFNLFLIMNYHLYTGYPALLSIKSLYSKMFLLWNIITLVVFMFLALKKYGVTSRIDSTIHPEGPATF